jgi:spore photoproduct lyase
VATAPISSELPQYANDLTLPSFSRAAAGALLDAAAGALAGAASPDLTVELITHRFTRSSKEVLRSWYPGSPLEMDESRRSEKRGRFGSRKWVYPGAEMRDLRAWFEAEVPARLPGARILYFT